MKKINLFLITFSTFSVSAEETEVTYVTTFCTENAASETEIITTEPTNTNETTVPAEDVQTDTATTVSKEWHTVKYRADLLAEKEAQKVLLTIDTC